MYSNSRDLTLSSSRDIRFLSEQKCIRATEQRSGSSREIDLLQVKYKFTRIWQW